MKSTRITFAILTATFALSCKRSEPGPSGPAGPPRSREASSPASSSSFSSSCSSCSSSSSRGSLATRLAREAAERPSGGLRAETVLTSLGRAGLAVGAQTQVLAHTIGARYCVSSATASGLALAVCEFSDEAGAERGLSYSRRVFDRLIPGRTLLRNQSTVLTLTPGDPSASLLSEASRAASAFVAL